jgi:Tol biopolymer transport system component
VKNLKIIIGSIIVVGCCFYLTFKSVESRTKLSPLTGEILISGVAYWIGNNQVHNVQSLDLGNQNSNILTTPVHPKQHDSISGRFALNGTKVIFDSVRDRESNQDTVEVYVMDYPSGNHQTNLTNNNGIDDETPDWCAVENKVVFNRWDINGSYSSIMKMNIDGSSIQQLTIGTAIDTEPRCSMDGSKIAFNRQSTTTDRAIFLADNLGGNLKRLTPTDHYCTNLNWSSDDEWLAAACNDKNNANESFSIYRMRPYMNLQNIHAADFERLTSPPSGFIDSLPVWAPDNSAIIFDRSEGTVLSFQPHILDLNSGTITLLAGTQNTMMVSDWR